MIVITIFLDDRCRLILRIYVVEKITETTNSVANDEERHITIDIPINEDTFLYFIPTGGSHMNDEGTSFYKG